MRSEIRYDTSMRDSRPSIVYIEAVSSILLVKEVTEVGLSSIYLKFFQIPTSHRTGQRNYRCGHPTVYFHNAERDFTKKML